MSASMSESKSEGCGGRVATPAASWPLRHRLRQLDDEEAPFESERRRKRREASDVVAARAPSMRAHEIHLDSISTPQRDGARAAADARAHPQAPRAARVAALLDEHASEFGSHATAAVIDDQLAAFHIWISDTVAEWAGAHACLEDEGEEAAPHPSADALASADAVASLDALSAIAAADNAALQALASALVSARAAPTPSTSDASPWERAAAAPAARRSRGGAAIGGGERQRQWRRRAGGGAEAAGIGAVDRPRGAAAVAVQRRIDGSVDADEPVARSAAVARYGPRWRGHAVRRVGAVAVRRGGAGAAPAAVARKGKAIFDALAAVRSRRRRRRSRRRRHHRRRRRRARAAASSRAAPAPSSPRRPTRRVRAPRPRAPRLGAAEHAARGPLRLDGGGEAGDAAAAAEAGRAGEGRLAAGQQQYLGGVNFT